MDPPSLLGSLRSIYPILCNSDILWEIFTINADPSTTKPRLYSAKPDLHYPLKTARYTSQVCRLWRANILSLQRIWANCVDIGAFEYCCDEWRQEVMIRTGSSALCVRGNLREASGLKWLSPLLNPYWERIRILDISFTGSGLSSFDEGSRIHDLHPFTRPAPLLEIFKCDRLPSRLAKGSQQLFSDNAPNLREFFCPPLPWNLQGASWARCLVRAVTISSSETLTLLGSLSQILNLESLTLQGIDFNSALSNFAAFYDSTLEQYRIHNPVFLPNLRSLTVYNRDFRVLEPTILLLENTVLPPNCSIILDGFTFPSEDMGSEKVERLCNPISQHSQKTLKSTDTRHLSIHITNNENKLVISMELIPPRSRRSIYPEYSILSLSMQTHWRFKTGAASAILKAVSAGFNPSLITSLDLVLDELCLGNAEYVHFAAALSAVERLEVTKAALNFLRRYSVENSIVIFPLLKCIVVNGWPWSEPEVLYSSMFRPHWEDIKNAIIAFLQLRKSSSCPTLETLDLKQWATLWTDWAALDQFVGMNVIGKLVFQGGFLDYVVPGETERD